MTPRAFLRILCAAALLAAALPAAARAADLDAATAAFRAGNAAYERGDYAAAEREYARAADLGANDARLHYNRAGALFRLNRLGPAILHYEKARKLAPADPDILHNLEFARARTADKVAEPPANLLTRALWGAHTAYSPRVGVWAAAALFAAGFLLLAVALLLPRPGRAAATIAASLCFAALLLFAPSLGFRLYRHETAARAVVLQPAVDLHSGPGAGYELLFRAHEGTTFTIVGRHGEWLSVKLPDGRGGYARAAAFGEV